jgi:hypothetical protein
MACLGRQSQARTTSELKRRLYSRICHGPAGDRTVTLQCPIKNHLGRKDTRSGGRRERESRREGRREQSLREAIAGVPLRVVTVEDILVGWTAALFAGRRQRAGLGRSVDCVGYLPAWRRADDSGCPEDAEEGNDVTHAPQSVCTRHKHERS